MTNKKSDHIDDISKTLVAISAAIHTGQTLNEIFDTVFTRLREVIPYDRIGLAMLDDAGELLTVVKVQSENPTLLGEGNACPLSETTLGKILQTREIRIIDDLPAYVEQTGRRTHYNNVLIREGIRSSLTIPLFVGDTPTGFIFFSSAAPHAYTDNFSKEMYGDGISLVDALKDNLAVALEKGIAVQRLRNANKHLKVLNTLKDEFLSIASHDLRTPLTSILGFVKIIKKRRNELTEEFMENALDRIARSAMHMLALVEDILDVAKINAGAMTLEAAPVDIAKILSHSLDEMAFNIADKDIEIERESAFERLTLKADASKLLQVFNNLIGNAIKFSPEQGTVVLRETGSDGEYRFEIADHGPGIAKQHQREIFKKFSKVADNAEMNAEGTGLGLMICKSIVELHGGDIGVDSEPGNGATFYFTLPIRKP